MLRFLIFPLGVFIICVLAQTNTREGVIRKFRQVTIRCRQSTNASITDINELIHHEPASSREGKCLRACIKNIYGMIDSSGKLVKSEIMKFTRILGRGNETKIKQSEDVVDECKDINIPDDSCEAANAYSNCMKKKAKERGISELFLRMESL